MEAKQTVSAAQFFGMMLVARSTLTFLSVCCHGGGPAPGPALFTCWQWPWALPWPCPCGELHRRYPRLPVGEVARRLLGRAGAGGPAVPSVPGGDGRCPWRCSSCFCSRPFTRTFPPGWFWRHGGGGGFWGLPRAGGRGPVRRVRAGAAGAGHGPGVWGGGPALSAGEPDAPLSRRGPGAGLKGAAFFLGRHAVCGHGRAAALCRRAARGWACRLGGGSSLLVGTAGAAGRVPGALCLHPAVPGVCPGLLDGVRSPQRLDPVFVALWMTGQIVKAACDLFACRVCLSSLGASGLGCWGGGVHAGPGDGRGLAAPASSAGCTCLWLALTALAGVGAPLALLVAARLRGERGRG